MVVLLDIKNDLDPRLSVLALSSRFDGLGRLLARQRHHHLSVLALSSRFDGRYSTRRDIIPPVLSVLALSSRFDGRCPRLVDSLFLEPFSTRSVESF